MGILFVACVCLALVVSPARSGGESLAQDEASQDLVRYQKDQDLVLETRDGGTSLWLGLRFQLRYTNLPGSPVDPATLPSQEEDDFSLNRGRIKGGGLGMLHGQWNAVGGAGDFSQSDIKRQNPSLLAIGFGGVYGRSQYTRFSSGGGTQLPGYETDGQNRYQLTQLMQDSSFRANGFSWQQELHWKEIEDRHEGSTRDLIGGYAQAGYFVHEAWDSLPEPLEVAFRYGVVDPDTSVRSNLQQEYTLGANWFFHGHRNKLTADTSYIDLDDPSDPSSEWRFRLQYELSI